jgi:ApbE superfamily uncharacterized protein (UPF0280 family)
MFNRLLKSDDESVYPGTASEPVKQTQMITKVTVRPNPFHTVLTLDVSCDQNKQVIVRMFNEDGRIIKMFSWYLVKGTNVTAVNELGNLSSGQFVVDIIDNEGEILFSTKLEKK